MVVVYSSWWADVWRGRREGREARYRRWGSRSGSWRRSWKHYWTLYRYRVY